ncbi:MAG: DUF2971 domain-containing protein, partial [Candidatus Edwardsbacteria bacterium]|nr:DUF2971 domain-containing protein [Candidatus Edwardsbacteria bacterium]
FDRDLLFALLIYMHTQKGITIAPFPVSYAKDYPLLNPYNLDSLENLTNLLTKSIDWSYEHEYRIMTQNATNIEVELPKGIIKRILLGCQISKQDKEEIITLVRTKDPKINIYQARMLDNKFGLSFDLIK